MRTFLYLLLVCLLLACERNTINNYYGDSDYTTAKTDTTGSAKGGSSGSDDSGDTDAGTDEGDDDSDGDDDSYYGDKGTDDSSDALFGDETDDGGGTTTVEGVQTVAQALLLASGTDVEVVGYVVGASKSSAKNTAFSAPFPSSANIVLADRPYEGDAIPVEELLQVKLTDNSSKTFRSQVNLLDHPERQNKRVQVSGTIGTYYKRLALVKVWQLQDLE